MSLVPRAVAEEGVTLMAHEMSYTLRCAPPKPKDDLGPDEGLTDRLLVISVVGLPGTGPGSYVPIQLGPGGAEALDPSIVLRATVVLLTLLQTRLTVRPAGVRAAITEALDELRHAMLVVRKLPGGQDSG